MYSLVPRLQGRRGATKAELLSAVYVPATGSSYADADEVFSAVVSADEGLGALDVIQGSDESPSRYQLTISQTLRMFYRQAKSMVQPEVRDDRLWERVSDDLTRKAPFDKAVPIRAPKRPGMSVSEIFEGVDDPTTNRLVVLDPREWTLLNGEDQVSPQ